MSELFQTSASYFTNGNRVGSLHKPSLSPSPAMGQGSGTKSHTSMGYRWEMEDGSEAGTYSVSAQDIPCLYNQFSSTSHSCLPMTSKDRRHLTCSISSCASFTKSTLFVSIKRAAALLSVSKELEEKPNNSLKSAKGNQQCPHLKGVPRTFNKASGSM